MELDESPRLTPPVRELDHAAGPEDAPVTLVEYGDYECPACGAAYPVLKRVRARLGPHLRFVFRNFPLTTLHPNAGIAAEAAEAAAEQGKFWEMHDALYEHQEELGEERIRALAEGLGLDLERFEAALESGGPRRRVREDFRSGVRSGANATPTFFVNGARWEDDWDEPTLLAGLTAAARDPSPDPDVGVRPSER